MRKVLQAFCLFLSTALVTVQTAQAANPNAASIFNSIGGTATIDRGGSMHSQARSIYSLGGGMVSFEGKKVSLLAADPPSFSAGCNGISWHFGGFAFISLDEIRQLVEAVAQASLGIAVDLAMQTLCPQCYAVMSKLRDMSNLMRNAAADACKIAQNMGAMLGKELGISPSTSRASDCSSKTAADGKTTGYLDSWAGSTCRMLSDANTQLDKYSKQYTDWMSGVSTAKTPDRDIMETSGNVTYKALSALGYEDGLIKDVLLSLIGMTVQHPESAADCRNAFSALTGSAKSNLEDAKLDAADAKTLNEIIATGSKYTVSAPSANAQPTPNDANVKSPTPGTGGAAKGLNICHAPPVLAGITAVGQSLICGFNVQAEITLFANNHFGGDRQRFLDSSLGSMCKNVTNTDALNPLVYTCRSDSNECLNPKMVRMQSLLTTNPVNGHTGLGFMVADALYKGVKAVKTGQPLDRTTTVRVLNGSGWPLYRLLNMAAVYPGLADELLNAYAAAIASQYAMDTLDKVARIGAQPAIDLRPSLGTRPESIAEIREEINQMIRMGNDNRSQSLARLAEKRQLVETIMQVNKTLQAEVIGQGLSGNTQLAVSIKRQAAAAAPAPKP